MDPSAGADIRRPLSAPAMSPFEQLRADCSFGRWPNLSSRLMDADEAG
jgi:hypothetical protein